MKRPTFVIILVLVGAAWNLGCSRSSGSVSPLSPVAASAAPAIVGESKCETVHFFAHLAGRFPNFSGTLTGDLEGTVAAQLDLDFEKTGVVYHNPGTETWTIQNSTVPALTGQTIHVESDGVVVQAPGQAPTFRMNGRSRILDGPVTGNLTWHGTFDVSVFPIAVELEYRGPVCR